MLKKCIEFLVTGFFVGKIPKAPGTWGTVLALFMMWGASPMALGIWDGQWQQGAYAFLIIATFVTWWLIHFHESHSNKKHDAAEIVIDEIIGFWITMVGISISWRSLALGFILFRLLDIIKPFPISYLDKNVKGGLGVLIDDVLAGVIACGVLHFMKGMEWLI